MANQPTFLGNRINLKNDIGSDATPYRFVEIDTTAGQFDTPSAGGAAVGLLEPNRNYESYVTPSAEEGSVMIDGVGDAECGGIVTVGDFLKLDTAGRVVSVGALSALSVSMSGTPFYIVARALESNVSGGRVSVQLQPHIIPAA